MRNDKSGPKSKTPKLPLFFKPLLWAYDFSSIDIEKDKKRIIVNTINYGQWKHWQWIVKNYGRKEVKQIIQNTPISEFRPSVLKLVSILLGIKNLKYASRSDKLKKARNFSET
ncbi:hypothetical protein J7J18_00400 [bacterium]|nr:hypothetical protein [bacterium]